LTKRFISVGPSLKSNWSGWVGQLPWFGGEAVEAL
jgi:hypothetical protein